MPYSFPCIEISTLIGHSGYVLAARYNRSGQYCMTGGQDKTIRLWNPVRGSLIKTYAGHGYEVRDLIISHDNAKFASCGGDKMVFLWDIASAQIVRRFQGHFNRVNCVAMNEDSSLLFSGSYDATVRIWDLKSHNAKPIQILNEAKDSVSSVEVLGEEILVSSVDGSIRTYDVRMGVINIDEMSHAVASAKFTHNEKYVIASTLNSKIALLDKASGEIFNEYVGHVNQEYRIDSISTPDDDFIICGSENGSVYFWDLQDATLAYTLHGIHTNAVCSLSHHPTETLLLSASLDGLVKVFGPS